MLFPPFDDGTALMLMLTMIGRETVGGKKDTKWERKSNETSPMKGMMEGIATCVRSCR